MSKSPQSFLLFPPGSVLGILGDGQLGRMTALAAARLGYRTHVFGTSAEAPAAQVTNALTCAAFEDREALARFAEAVDVVTLEWENVPTDSLAFLAERVPVRPGASVLRVAQDRREEKTFAASCGVPTTDWESVNNAQELDAALVRLGRPAVLKTPRLGYDGKGQVFIGPTKAAEEAWQALGSSEGILEAFVDFACEVSVIVARREDGVMAAYPPVRNIHRNHILATTHVPSGLPPEVEAEADAVARRLAERLDVVGLLAVEMFVLKAPDSEGRRVRMNEIAPRPHNSGHWTIDACACSQFEQLVRAVCGLPLGETVPHHDAVMENLLGEDANGWATLLQDPSACLHLYGKTDVRAGRKMGHVTHLAPRLSGGPFLLGEAKA